MNRGIIMKEMFTMWRHTNMVVLVALTAAIYAALLIPFQGIPIIPGHISLRIADIVPVPFALMFGPAGVWGAAIGNLIGDFFGTLSPGAIGGFAGQLLTGWITYKLWGAFAARHQDFEINVKSGRRFGRFVSISVIKGFLDPLILTFWVCLLLQLAPPQFYAIAVLSGMLASIIGGPIILSLLAPRIKKWGLLWTDIMEPEEVSKGFHPRVGVWLVVAGTLLGAASLYYTLFFSGLDVTNPIVRFSPIIFLVPVIVGSLMLGGRNQVEAARRADLAQQAQMQPEATS